MNTTPTPAETATKPIAAPSELKLPVNESARWRIWAGLHAESIFILPFLYTLERAVSGMEIDIADERKVLDDFFHTDGKLTAEGHEHFEAAFDQTFGRLILPELVDVRRVQDALAGHLTLEAFYYFQRKNL